MATRRKNNWESIPYRGLCAPRSKSGTVAEDLSKIFQCNDDQDISVLESRFSRGAECLRRRIREMSLHPANRRENLNKRKSHLIPVKLTYAFAKDCLRRYAPDKEVRDFEKDINARMAELLGYRRYSIENSIKRSVPFSRTLRRVNTILNPDASSTNHSSNNIADPPTPKTRRLFTSNRFTRRTVSSNNIYSNNLNNISNTGYNNIVVTLTRR